MLSVALESHSPDVQWAPQIIGKQHFLPAVSPSSVVPVIQSCLGAAEVNCCSIPFFRMGLAIEKDMTVQPITTSIENDGFLPRESFLFLFNGPHPAHPSSMQYNMHDMLPPILCGIFM